MTHTYTIRFSTLANAVLIAVLLALAPLVGCTKTIDTSLTKAREHAPMLVEVAKQDVEELQKGMPVGAAQLQSLFRAETAPKDDLDAVRKQLGHARNHVQDLRVAKSTFFVLAEKDGTILRSDREPDLLSSKNLFSGFPETRKCNEGTTVVSRGEMPEAAGVKDRKDGQFIVAVPVLLDNVAVGIYASGWSWAAYAYRLQNALLSDVRSKRKDDREKDPLLYVYLVVGPDVFGAPTAPEVNAEAIRKLQPLTKAIGESVFATAIEVTGREFGLAVRRASTLGVDVAVAVIRSET
ncbi:MAG TPA: hypothetical protein VIV60_34755 [Polyangiaceae bacterium]